MTAINFGEWTPDQPDLGSGCVDAKNVIPTAVGYRPLPSLAALSGAADARLRGVYAAKQSNGTVKIFAGDSTKLYEFAAADSGLDNISKSGNYTLTGDEGWRFVQFGNIVIAASNSQILQSYTLGSSSLFADVTGAPTAKYIAVVRDFVMTANTSSSNQQVRWSGIGDSTSWAQSATTQADSQTIYGLGAITGLVGGEFATILCEEGIVRATYAGSPLVFQFDAVETARGCAIPGTVASIGGATIYWSGDGFYLFDGATSQAIGAEKVDRFFADDLNIGDINRCSAAIDPVNKLYVLAYSDGNGGSQPNTLLMFNYALGRWSRGEVSTDLVAPIYTAGYSMETLDNISSSLDALPASLDSPIFNGGQFAFAGSDDSKISTFTGAALTSVIETGEQVLPAGQRALVNAVTPLVTGVSPTTTVQVLTRNRQQDTETATTAASVNADGWAPVRSNGRFHRVRLNVSGTWTDARGVDVQAQAAGLR